MVELYGALLAVNFVQCKPHRHPHEECLRQLDAPVLYMQKITIIQSLQTEITKFQIAISIQNFSQTRQIKLRQTLIQQLGINPSLDEIGEIICVSLRHRLLYDFFTQHLETNGMQ